MLRRLQKTRFGFAIIALPALGLLSIAVSQASAQQPLHEQIDKMIESAHAGPMAPLTGDGEFMRRVYLDLIGTIPTAAELRMFLADKSPQKRQQLIDRLLADPRYVTHMATVFDVMMMERRADKHVKSPEWRQYLQTSFAENKPYLQLAREILGADGVDPKQRAAVKFYLDREGETNLLTRDVGRVFFGKDFQCAQCHDHPLIDSYLQSDYYGIYAFLNRSYVFADKKAKKSYFAEKAAGVAKYKSVFTDIEGQANPQVPGGVEIVEPAFKKGEEYKVKPPKGGRGIPKFSRREALPAAIADGTNLAFNRNIANRLWAHMMGRGLVHPVDLHHDDNPPSHPELLDALANELTTMKYDVKAFLRELALSQTYQRAIDAPSIAPQQIKSPEKQLAEAEANQKRLAAAAEKSKQAADKAATDLAVVEKEIKSLTEQLTKTSAATAAAKKAADQATATLSATQKQMAAKQDIAKALSEAAAKTQEAVKKLPAEKDLAAAAAKFTTRSSQLAAEVATLTKTVATQAANAQAMSAKFAVAQKVASETTTKINTAKKQVETTKQQLTAAKAQNTSHQSAAKEASNKLTSIKKLADYSKLVATAESSKTAFYKTQAELIAGRKILQQATAQLPKKQAELAADQKANVEAAKRSTASAQQLATKQGEVKLVADALDKANAAVQKQPKDAIVVDAAAKVKATHVKLVTQLAPIQKTAAADQAASKSAATKLASTQKAINDLNTQIAAQKQQVPKIEVQAKTLTAKLKVDRAAVDAAYAGVAHLWTERFAVASLKPLTPEQLAWSIMQAAGVIQRQRTAEEAVINKKTPLTDAIKKDPAKLAERNRQIELAVYNKLKGQANAFISLFGAGAGQPQQDFFATVDQALFFANGSQVRAWLAPSAGSVVQQALKHEDPKLLAEEIYMSILTRSPSNQEVTDVAQYIASRPKDKKTVVVQEIAWALLTSTEFRFSH